MLREALVMNLHQYYYGSFLQLMVEGLIDFLLFITESNLYMLAAHTLESCVNICLSIARKAHMLKQCT